MGVVTGLVTGFECDMRDVLRTRHRCFWILRLRLSHKVKNMLSHELSSPSRKKARDELIESLRCVFDNADFTCSWFLDFIRCSAI
jgi:hypothetical protein